MSISYVVPVWREDVYKRTALPWIQQQVDRFGGELIEVRGSGSIFEAQESGRLRAKGRYIMYVHDDVKLLSPINLKKAVSQTFNRFKNLGLMGPAGKVQCLRVPWWRNKGNYVGHWCRRGDRNQLVYQYANDRGSAPFRDVEGDPFEDWTRRNPRWDRFEKAGMVDGFYLIEDTSRMGLAWDTETFGDQWHAYDVDRCMQAHESGLDVMVSPWLFLHDNAGHAGYKGSDPARIHGRDQGNRRINSKGDAIWLADLDTANHQLQKKWDLQCGY